MESNKLLEKINDSIEDAIKPILKKGESMTPVDLDNLTKAVCIVEKIKRIEGGNSFDDEDYSDDGYSYRRGRSPITGRYVSRDSMPNNRHYDYHDTGNTMHSTHAYDSGASTRRYYDGSNSRGNYSGHSIQDRMIDRLERMIDEAQNEHERETVAKWIKRLKD